MTKRIELMPRLSPFLLLIGVALTVGSPVRAAQPRPQGPCDIYLAAGTPCVAAHSTTRALYASYDGPLYQVKRLSDGATLDIGVVLPTDLPFSDAGGYAGSAAQDAFCAHALCVINVIYDQSGKGNHLYQAPPGPNFKGPAKGAFDTQPIADMAPITISGHKAYGVYIMPGMGMRNNNASDVAILDEPEGIYSVVDGTHYDSGCCFNYGNASTNGLAVGTGTMETTYFGTSTVWGRGEGTGPWIMSDMEAGLFSGYDAKLNAADPTIDSWRFVTAVVDGGGGNRWDLRGGNAQEGGLTTFYSGVRPHSLTDSRYYPMRRQGAILLGNGGDNGNGSAGTFFEGVMVTGYPTEATTDAVQANIVAAKYNASRLGLSRVTTLTPGSTQSVTATFTNASDAPVAGVTLSVSVPTGWTSSASRSPGSSVSFDDPVAPGASVNAVFELHSPAMIGAGYLTGKVEWIDPSTGRIRSETTAQRLRNAPPVKINEVRLAAGANSTDQFIELYNASDRPVDVSGWTLVNTQTQWASVKLATIPPHVELAPGAYYLLGLANSGLAAPANAGATTIEVSSTTGFAAGQQIEIDGETHTVTSVGDAATAMTTVFIPVSTGPWLSVPAGATNLPVADASGFTVGQKIGIDIGGNYEVATVTAVGKAATQTTLSAAAKAGQTNIKVRANSNMTVGDTLTLDTGRHVERVKIAAIGTPGENGAGIDLAAPLQLDHRNGVDVSDVGTGISFSPATKFTHISGEAVQALGSGITLDRPLTNSHEYGAAVINRQVKTEGYRGAAAPNQWFGGALSTRAGSLALLDARGELVVDAMVYGSQQSNSSANGTITSPELATLEGDQRQGGCIVIAPRPLGGFSRFAPPSDAANVSLGRYPDGADADSNCSDFVTPPAAFLSAASVVGANNIKIDNVEGFSVGQTIMIDTGSNLETRVIERVGTSGASTLAKPADATATEIAVAGVMGFRAGQTITIDSGAMQESAEILTVSRRGATVSLSAPLRNAHAAGAQVSGTGITLSASLTKAHASGTQLADSIPTPGAANKYQR